MSEKRVAIHSIGCRDLLHPVTKMHCKPRFHIYDPDHICVDYYTGYSSLPLIITDEGDGFCPFPPKNRGDFDLSPQCRSCEKCNKCQASQ